MGIIGTTTVDWFTPDEGFGETWRVNIFDAMY
jgi:hypothetical protein